MHPFHYQVLQHYVATFDFSHNSNNPNNKLTTASSTGEAAIVDANTNINHLGTSMSQLNDKMEDYVNCEHPEFDYLPSNEQHTTNSSSEEIVSVHSISPPATTTSLPVTTTDCSFSTALRNFLGHFRLPGEAQCIDRLMEAFAIKLFADLGEGKPFASSDAAFILAFSTILLNTDLHNPQIQDIKRMTKDQFIRNNRGINNNQDIPREYLEALYDEIKMKQIKMDLDINDTDGSALDFSDSVMWQKLLSKSAADQVPAAFTPTVAARQHASVIKTHISSKGANRRNRYRHGYRDENGDGDSDGDRDGNRTSTVSHLHSEVGIGVLGIPSEQHEKDMFLVMATPMLETLLTVWEIVEDDQTVRRIAESLYAYSTICMNLGLRTLLNRMIEVLATRICTTLGVTRSLHMGYVMRSKGRHGQSEGRSHALAMFDAKKANPQNIARLLCADPELLVISRQRSHSMMLNSSNYSTPLTDASPNSNGEGKRYSQFTGPSMDGGGSRYGGEMDFDWKGAHIVRGEIMIRVLFHMTATHASLLSGNIWGLLAKLLLYVRNRGALPLEISEITHDFEDILGSDYALIPTDFAVTCHCLARGLLPPQGLYKRVDNRNTASGKGEGVGVDEKSQGGGIWMSVATLGGLLWTPGVGSGTVTKHNVLENDMNRHSADFGSVSDRRHGGIVRGALQMQHLLDANSGLLNTSTNNELFISTFLPEPVGTKNVRTGKGVNSKMGLGSLMALQGVDKDSFAILDSMLGACISMCRPEDSVLKITSTLDDVVFVTVVSNLLQSLLEITDELLSLPPAESLLYGTHGRDGGLGGSDSRGNKSNPTTGGDAKHGKALEQKRLGMVTAAANREIDAVVMLEWVYRIMIINKSRFHLVWPKFHGKLC